METTSSLKEMVQIKNDCRININKSKKYTNKNYLMNILEIETIHQFPYKLDEFQVEGMKSIMKGENILICSHTGAGKSSLAEFGIAYANSLGKRAIYTSPIKALSNQKYGDFQKVFKTSVGIMTGDIKVNPDADILVCTTEIVNNLLYTNIEYFDDVSTLCLDEVHYIRDKDRGKIWESVIAMIPKHITLIMLSATIPGAEAFAKWVSTIKDRECKIYGTNKRPVPLVHNIYWNGTCKQIMNEANEFDFLSYKHVYSKWKEYDNKNKSDKKSNSTLMKEFLDMLDVKELFPALFFEFSRKQCEKYAAMIQRSWLSGKEQTECINLFELNVKKFLGEGGMQLEQVWMVRSLLMKGVCIHHSGLIPILKEIIETIFDKGFIKIMFVTETFAVGINMPTKAVVFGSLQKFDGNGQRILIPEEYCQMAGRAGRRGKDTLGTVIYFPMPPKAMLRGDEYSTMAVGKHSLIKSKFVIDPLILIKCVDIDKDPMEIIKATLLYQEVKIYGIGIRKEIEIMKNNILFIEQSMVEKFNEFNHLKNKLQFLKPKQKKVLQNEIKKIKEVLGENNIKILTNNSSIHKDIAILEMQEEDNNNFISNTLNWQYEVLRKVGYLRNLDEFQNMELTVKGKAASFINESDSFLVIEYLNKFISKIEELDSCHDISIYLSFIIGSIVDEKECIKQEEDGVWCVDDMVTELVSYKESIQIIKEELNELQETYNTLMNEDRLQNDDTNISKLFGGYVYLWTIEKLSYNELKHKVGCEIYEGNFVKNMLKVHNICEEWKSVAEVYQKPIITESLHYIQSNVIRDIVICDSLYIRS